MTMPGHAYWQITAPVAAGEWGGEKKTADKDGEYTGK
jgi:hypothetical protein